MQFSSNAKVKDGLSDSFQTGDVVTKFDTARLKIKSEVFQRKLLESKR